MSLLVRLLGAGGPTVTYAIPVATADVVAGAVVISVAYPVPLGTATTAAPTPVPGESLVVSAASATSAAPAPVPSESLLVPAATATTAAPAPVSAESLPVPVAASTTAASLSLDVSLPVPTATATTSALASGVVITHQIPAASASVMAPAPFVAGAETPGAIPAGMHGFLEPYRLPQIVRHRIPVALLRAEAEPPILTISYVIPAAQATVTAIPPKHTFIEYPPFDFDAVFTEQEEVDIAALVFLTPV